MLYQAYVHVNGKRQGSWRDVGSEDELRDIAERFGSAVRQFRVSGLAPCPLMGPAAKHGFQVVVKEYSCASNLAQGWGMRGNYVFMCLGTNLDTVLKVRDALI